MTRSLASFTAALALLPGQAPYLIDRARASATLQKWAAAESDLSSALTAEPGSVEACIAGVVARLPPPEEGATIVIPITQGDI